MTANVNVTKVLFKRGNTAQNATYTGINGEITVDTQAKTLRIHDGVTAGGNVIIAGGVVGSYSNTNAAAYIPTDPTITSLQSNAGIQATAINTINANIGAYQTFANANAATQATGIDTINANLGSFQTYANIHFGDSNYGNTNVAAYLGVFNGNILPAANVTYSLGDSTHQWKDLWVSNNTIYIGNTPIRVDGGTLLVNNAPVSGGSNIGNLQIDNNNNQLSFGPGESYSFLYMKNDGSETRLANDNGNVQISTIKQGPGGGTYFWTFDDTGNILLPNNSSSINYANGVSILSGLGGAVYGNIVVGTSEINFVANSSGDGYGFSTIELRPDTNAYDDSYLIIDPTYPSHIHIRAGGAQDNSLTELYLGGENSHFKVNNGLNPDVSIAANNYVWLFGTDGSLTFPTGGNVIFDNSSTSIIDGVTNINAVGTIGANVIQVLSDLTSFGASPAPRIYGFSSIATTGSAVNEGNISASGNLVTGRNAYVTGNVFAAQYNFANGVNILDTITGVTSISSVVNTSIWSDASGDYQYGTLDYSYAVNGNNGQFAIQYSFPLVYGNVDVNVGNVIASNVTTTNGIFWANGQAYSTGGGSYGNTEVAAYLPAYTGNLGAGRAQVTNAVDFMYGGFPYMGWQLSGSDTLKLRTNIASGDYTNDAIIVDRQSLAVNVVATLSAGNIITTSGVFWANGSAYATSGGSYGNTQVAAYLPTYTGNISAGNVNVTSTVYAANIVTSGTSGNISGVNVISANTFVFAANGVNILSAAGGGTYGNTEVAAYLLTWPNINIGTTNITNGNVTTLRASNFNSANAVISGGYISALTNASITTATITTLNSTGGNITTLRATNFGTANAVITGGYINSLANLTATTTQTTNLSTGNAVISGGYISALTNAYITTSAITNFSTANAVITGGYASGLANVTATGNVTAGNLIGYGSNTSITAGTYTSTFDNVGMVTVPNLTVSGSVDATSITTDSLTINDTGWTNFTPTWYANVTANSMGDGLAEGRYRQLGKTVEVWMQITMGSTTTFGTGEYKVSLPVASRMLGSAVLSLVMIDSGTRLYNSLAHNAYTTTIIHTNSNVTLFWDTGVVTNTAPFTWTSGDSFVIAGTYEAE